MSFQAYLDTVEAQTGITPRQFIELARERGFGPETPTSPILMWLKQEHDLGHGHAMAIVYVIKNGEKISSKHVGSTGSHRDAKDTLWLDGVATKPEGY
jgi:hypothetical protein